MSGMTTPTQDFLVDTTHLTLEFVSDIISDIQALGEYAPAKEFFWNRKISRLTTNISQFVELTTLMSKTLQAKKNITVPGIKESHIHLLFIMKGMNQAQLKQDYMALEELIKYELKDNLTQWKIDLIPQTRKLLNF